MLATARLPQSTHNFTPKPHIASLSSSRPPSREKLPLPLPPPHPYTIRNATVEDAAVIVHLGRTVFAETFGFSIPSKDLTAYLDEAYTVAAIEAEISSKTRHLLVACSPSGEAIGFAQLTEGSTDPLVAHLANVVELQRLYVLAEHRRQGVGKCLTKRLEQIALELGYQTMWLGVWEGHFLSQMIYEAMGFTRVGDHEFTMGRCIQTDWIMCKELAPN